MPKYVSESGFLIECLFKRYSEVKLTNINKNQIQSDKRRSRVFSFCFRVAFLLFKAQAGGSNPAGQ